MSDITARLQELKIIPVIVLGNADDASPLAEAMIAGGKIRRNSTACR